MMNLPKDLNTFKALSPWWRTEFPTEAVLSSDGVGDLLSLLDERGRRPFFVIDAALKDQPRFAPIFAQDNLFAFDASFSEPRTGDVDSLRDLIIKSGAEPDTIVGIGGGASMDLAKAVGICLANPKPAQCYQGFGLEMSKGCNIWSVPALNGTGAEITPIAVLRGPEKKLGINNKFVEPEVAVIDPRLSENAPHFNRFFTMMDCYFHHSEIIKSKTSAPEAAEDSKEGLEIARFVLSHNLKDYDLTLAIASAIASVLGGSSSISGRVGAAHAISYGLSNCAPHLPHSVAVTISMSALQEVYPDAYADVEDYLEINGFDMPKASDYGITPEFTEKMTKTALGLDKLWQSCFGNGWREIATKDYIENIYRRITKE